MRRSEMRARAGSLPFADAVAYEDEPESSHGVSMFAKPRPGKGPFAGIMMYTISPDEETNEEDDNGEEEEESDDDGSNCSEDSNGSDGMSVFAQARASMLSASAECSSSDGDDDNEPFADAEAYTSNDCDDNCEPFADAEAYSSSNENGANDEDEDDGEEEEENEEEELDDDGSTCSEDSNGSDCMSVFAQARASMLSTDAEECLSSDGDDLFLAAKGIKTQCCDQLQVKR